MNSGITNGQMARLLGLSLPEMEQLQHLGLQAYKNEQGDTEYYYVQISSNNPQQIREKINMDRSFVARFTARRVEQIKREVP